MCQGMRRVGRGTSKSVGLSFPDQYFKSFWTAPVLISIIDSSIEWQHQFAKKMARNQWVNLLDNQKYNRLAQAVSPIHGNAVFFVPINNR